MMRFYFSKVAYCWESWQTRGGVEFTRPNGDQMQRVTETTYAIWRFRFIVKHDCKFAVYT